MERLFTVEFGPSRSKRFGRALDEARRLARECSEVEPGKYRARFALGTDSAAYAALASLLERVEPSLASPTRQPAPQTARAEIGMGCFRLPHTSRSPPRLVLPL